MLVIPSVDLIEGRVARLIKGKIEHARFYEHFGDPVAVAKIWEFEGAGLIHVVDLDAALGRGDNIKVIGNIIRALRVPVQVGGGVRSLERARQIIGLGASRVVIGSMAFKDPEAIKTLLGELGSDRVVVALDHSDGVVMVSGWREDTGVSLRGAAERFTSMGVRFLLVTSIQRDGTLAGPDIENLSKILDLDANIIASGGIRSLEDIIALKKLGVYGVIVGRALYEGCFNLKEALKVASE
ncbi:MAG: 1-(5-phosphoribosyl)-5-[(5-phosphoribosylamino)methylideneamino]imidazole-4-carboxamide isomerase [Candidatus Bathyarchaeia archaeon]|nr:1-(5-phosphoribosyl)-5-[(5-phosphoribosylamino)methylideneamino]imidazole-4-carboxamide isomerase [Candidatus Bathyarchaeota archaeon]